MMAKHFGKVLLISLLDQNLRLTFKRAVLHVATRYLLRSSFVVALSLSLLLGGFEDLAEDAQLVTGVTQGEKRIHFNPVTNL